MATGQSETLLHGLSAEADRFGIAAGEVMGGREAILNIAFCGSCGLMRIACSQMVIASSDRPSSASANAEIAMRGGEVRVEIECALEFFDRLVGAPPRQGHIAEREMRPWVAIVEFRARAARVAASLTCGSMTIQPT